MKNPGLWLLNIDNVGHYGRVSKYILALVPLGQTIKKNIRVLVGMRAQLGRTREGQLKRFNVMKKR